MFKTLNSVLTVERETLYPSVAHTWLDVLKGREDKIHNFFGYLREKRRFKSHTKYKQRDSLYKPKVMILVYLG